MCPLCRPALGPASRRTLKSSSHSAPPLRLAVRSLSDPTALETLHAPHNNRDCLGSVRKLGILGDTARRRCLHVEKVSFSQGKCLLIRPVICAVMHRRKFLTSATNVTDTEFKKFCVIDIRGARQFSSTVRIMYEYDEKDFIRLLVNWPIVKSYICFWFWLWIKDKCMI